MFSISKTYKGAENNCLFWAKFVEKWLPSFLKFVFIFTFLWFAKMLSTWPRRRTSNVKKKRLPSSFGFQNLVNISIFFGVRCQKTNSKFRKNLYYVSFNFYRSFGQEWGTKPAPSLPPPLSLSLTSQAPASLLVPHLRNTSLYNPSMLAFLKNC